MATGLIPLEDYEHALAHLCISTTTTGRDGSGPVLNTGAHILDSKVLQDGVPLRAAAARPASVLHHHVQQNAPSVEDFYRPMVHLPNVKQGGYMSNTLGHEVDVYSASYSSTQSSFSSASSSSTLRSTLPLEIIALIARELSAASEPTDAPPWLTALYAHTLHESSSTRTPAMNAAHRAMLALSATCKAYRALLAPAIWRAAHFRHPRHLGELLALMRNYRALASPLHRRRPPPTGLGRLSDTGNQAQGSATGPRRRSPSPASEWAWNEGFPLRLVHELHITMPQRYPGFAQELLVELLRNGMNHNLAHVVWEAEELPAGSALRAMVRPRDHTDGRRRASIETRGQSSGYNGEIFIPSSSPDNKMLGLGAEVGTEEVVEWMRNSRDGEAFPSGPAFRLSSSDGQPHLPADAAAAEEEEPNEDDGGCCGLTSLSINCKCFWPGHPALQLLRTLRHLRLINYDLFLLPPHLPALLQNLERPLLSLSLSTSKTSLLHSLPLVMSGCFDRLEVLDLFPVTPEFPLPQAIRRMRRTLRVLRLNIDISANFANYDAFWRILTGDDEDESEGENGTSSAASRQRAYAAHSSEPQREYDIETSAAPMEALEALHIDPLPQPNTAPSFAAFVARGSPRLRYINGKRKDSFAPGMHDVDPDYITSALAY